MKIIKQIIAITTLSAACPAMASSSNQAYVGEIFGMARGVVLFNHAGVRSTLPSCGTPNPVRWAFDVTTPAGQARLSMLLSAKAMHLPIMIYGTGACTDWGDTETVDYFVVLSQ